MRACPAAPVARVLMETPKTVMISTNLFGKPTRYTYAKGSGKVLACWNVVAATRPK